MSDKINSDTVDDENISDDNDVNNKKKNSENKFIIKNYKIINLFLSYNLFLIK